MSLYFYKSYRRSLSLFSPSLVFILSRSFSLRTAPHYLNAWSRLTVYIKLQVACCVTWHDLVKFTYSTDIKGQHWVSSSLNYSGARVTVVFDWNILQKCLATSCSTFQSAVQEKNVDLHLRLQRLTTRIFDYQPKNGQKRKRVSKYKSSVKRATVNYFSIVFLEFCNLKWLIITECNQSRWQIRVPCAYIRLNFDRFSSGRKCCLTEMK